ncbi:hypothetical protein [Campylobacter hyointestinalis]|uniref:hypothetical protein n=1 Tax=Campylobacter hyointestinalis TaxID=198 RepID=UPI0015EF221A|nr:hypothetical protein [Campylobacter hyointestinalis]
MQNQKDELIKLVNNVNFILSYINTSNITDMSSLFEPNVCLVAVIAPFLASIIK